MNTQENRLLRLLQTDFPICERPFACLAEQTGLTEAEVLALVRKWQAEGLIRRIGPLFNSAALGYKSTLCAAQVPPPRLDEVAEKINSLPGVTHNYLRDHRLNLWFTLTMPDETELARTIAQLENELGITILNLPAERKFKLRTLFELSE